MGRFGAQRSAGERLQNEHAGLRTAVTSAEESIRRLLELGWRGRSERRALRNVLRQLASLEVQLGNHFAAEEAAGHLAEALQAAPRYHTRAAALLAQHPDFSAEMHRVVSLARYSLNSPDDWEEVHRSFAQLAALLCAHEEAEGEIVRCSLLDDLGTVD